MWETLPNWFWGIYYSFFLITLVMAIFNIVKKRLINISIITVVLSFVIPIASFFYSIGRIKGLNELEYLIHNLQQGELWSIFITVLYLYIIFWWFFTIYVLLRRH
ncbi:hypothetical protein ACLIA0_13700 [Bacillaceae bacterium W0354]